jgi:HK97 family phage portal protein
MPVAWPFRRSREQQIQGALRTLAKYDWSFGNIPNFGQSLARVPFPGTSRASIVTLNSAVGLEAVGECIRLVSMTQGMVPLCVYEGDRPEISKARESWQWYRLHEQPNDDQSAFDFLQDVGTSIETDGNAWIWKAVVRRPVREPDDIQLFVMDPSQVRTIREDGVKRFKVREGGTETTYGKREILHVRGWTPFLGLTDAPSPVALHRDVVGTALDRRQYEAAFFQNGAQFSIAIVVPGPLTDADAREISDTFVAQHTGPNAYRPAVISDGGDIKTFSLSPKDAQYIEQKQFNIEETARIFHITTLGMLKPGNSSTSDDFLRFMSVDMAPRLRRVEMAFRGDQDLFPRGSNLFCEFLDDAVLRPDIQKRYDAYRLATQGGWITGNEIREKENLPYHPQGEGLQETPVGGAPNPSGQQPASGEPSSNGQPAPTGGGYG